MIPIQRTVWHNVPARAQATEESGGLGGLSSALSKQAEQGVQNAVKEYLDGKGDARLAELVNRIKLVVTFAGGALLLYLLSQSGVKR